MSTLKKARSFSNPRSRPSQGGGTRIECILMINDRGSITIPRAVRNKLGVVTKENY